jgi:hypothetical protein
MSALSMKMSVWMPAMICLILAAGCQTPPSRPPSQNLKPTLAAPECPKIGGVYELYGEPLPGSVDFYRNRNSKLTLNAMLGLSERSELVPGAERVEVLQDDTLELINRHEGAIAAHELDLQPDDKVECRPNHITIQRMRVQIDDVPEPVAVVSTTDQELTIEDDGSLLIRTRIVSEGKSTLFPMPVPPEEYAARFKRLF